MSTTKWFLHIFATIVSATESLPSLYLSEGETAVIELSTVFAGTLLNYSIRSDPQHRASLLTDITPTLLESLSATARKLGPVFEAPKGNAVLLYSDRRIELWSEGGEEIWGLDTSEDVQRVDSLWPKETAMVWTKPQHAPGVLYTLNVTSDRPELVQVSGVTLPQSAVVAVCSQREGFFIITEENSRRVVTFYTIDFEVNAAKSQADLSFYYEEGDIIDAVCIAHLYLLTPEMIISENGFSYYLPQRFGRLMGIRSFIGHRKWSIASENGLLLEHVLLAFQQYGRFEIEQYTEYETSLCFATNGNQLLAVYYWMSSKYPISCVFSLNFPFSAEDLLDVKTLRVTKELPESVVLVSTKKGVFIYRVTVAAPAVLVRAGPPYSFQLCAEELTNGASILCKTVTLRSTSTPIVPSEGLNFSCFLVQPGQNCHYRLPEWLSGAGLAITSSNSAVTVIPPFIETNFEFEAFDDEQFLCFGELSTRFSAVSKIGKTATFAELETGVRTPFDLPVTSCIVTGSYAYLQSASGSVYSQFFRGKVQLELSLEVQGRLLHSNNSPFFVFNCTVYERLSERYWLSLDCGCGVLDVCRSEDRLLVLCEGVVRVYTIRHGNYSLSITLSLPNEAGFIKYWNRRLVTLSTDGPLTVYYLSNSGRLVLLYAVEVGNCRFAEGELAWESVFLVCERRVLRVDVAGRQRVMWEIPIQKGTWVAVTGSISALQLQGRVIKASVFTPSDSLSPAFQLQHHSAKFPASTSLIVSTLQVTSNSDSLSVPLTLTVRNCGALLKPRQSTAELTVPWSNYAEIPLWNVAGGSGLRFSIASDSNTDDITAANACEVQYSMSHDCAANKQISLLLDTSVLLCPDLSGLRVTTLRCERRECAAVRKQLFTGADFQLLFIVGAYIIASTRTWALIAVSGRSDGALKRFKVVVARLDLKSLKLAVINSCETSEEADTMMYAVKETENLYHLFTNRASLRHHVISLVSGDQLSVHEEQYTDYRLMNVELLSSEKQGDVLSLYVLIRSKKLLEYRLHGRLTLVKVTTFPQSLYALPSSYQLCRDRFILVNQTAAYSFSLSSFALLGTAHPPKGENSLHIRRNLISSIDAECNRVALHFKSLMISIVDFAAPAESTLICVFPYIEIIFTSQGAYGIRYQSIDVLKISSPKLVINAAESGESIRTLRLEVLNCFGETAEIAVSVIRNTDFNGKLAVGVVVLCGLLVCMATAGQCRRRRVVRGEIEMESRAINSDSV